jgi:hypothetical protein
MIAASARRVLIPIPTGLFPNNLRNKVYRSGVTVTKILFNWNQSATFQRFLNDPCVILRVCGSAEVECPARSASMERA